MRKFHMLIGTIMYIYGVILAINGHTESNIWIVGSIIVNMMAWEG